jgi:hypothetical protein
MKLAGGVGSSFQFEFWVAAFGRKVPVASPAQPDPNRSVELAPLRTVRLAAGDIGPSAFCCPKG